MRRSPQVLTGCLRRLAPIVLGLVLLGPPAAAADTHTIDTERSTITVRVYKSGLFRAFADNHIVQAQVTEGTLDDGPAARVAFAIDSARLRVLDPGLSADAREQVQSRMLGPEVLDVQRYPEIRFQSSAIERRTPEGWIVRGLLTLHGQAHEVTVTVTPAQGRYRATVKLRQTDFGITPISIGGGAVSVKDEVQIDADIVVAPPAGTVPTASRGPGVAVALLR
jgi:polyisoprenoid-binding protein YceI